MSKFIEIDGKKLEIRGSRLVPEFTLKPLKGGKYHLQRRLFGRSELMPGTVFNQGLAKKRRNERVGELFPRSRQPKPITKKIEDERVRIPKARKTAIGYQCPWPNCRGINSHAKPGLNFCIWCRKEFEVVNFQRRS